MKNRGKLKIAIAWGVLIVALATVGFYLGQTYNQERKFDKLEESAAIDLLELYKQNPDMVGWIQIKGTNINYPVMGSEDYLHLNFEKEYSDSGTPFIAYGCDVDSINVLIYGHNMSYNGNMFHQLTKYTDKAFWEKNPKAIFYAICTDSDGEKYVEKRTYKIMSAIPTTIDSWKYWNYAISDTHEELEQYVSECRERELYDTGVELTDKVLSLSTCSYHVSGRNGRFVLVSTLEKVELQNTVDDE